MMKTKSLHNIMIEGCNFTTQLQYNLNSNHITISTKHKYQDPNYSKEYQNNNKNKIKKYQKQYREDNKDKAKEYHKQHYIDNRDPNATLLGSDEWKIKMSCACQKIDIEDFNGFVKDQKYCYKFNNKCRESNREKFDRRCFICNKDEIKNGKKLSVHHIDMNKQQGCDNTEWKLVPVCARCHRMLHTELWQSRIEYLLGNLYKDSNQIE